MYKKRHVKRAAAVLLSIMMVLASGSAIYAFEGGSYHDFREGEISIYLPDGWTSEEIDAGETGERSYEQIFKAQDGDGDSGLSFSLYYASKDAQGDYIYFDDNQEEALRYYGEYGEEAVEGLYDAVLAWPLEEATQSEWSVSEPEFFKGQWNGFLVAKGNGNTQAADQSMTFGHTIYLTAQMADDSETMVHMLLVFYSDDYAALTEEQEQLAKEVADEFYDYDYYNVMTGNSNKDSALDWDEDSEDSIGDIIIGMITILATLIGIISAAIVFVRKHVKKRFFPNRDRRKGEDKGARSFSAGFTGIQQSFDLGDAVSKFKKRRAEKTSFSGQEQRKEKRTIRKEGRAERREERRPLHAAERRSTMQMRNREAESAEQRYYASLQTLQKSGLLTKEEMRDMLDRHERSKARQRNR